MSDEYGDCPECRKTKPIAMFTSEKNGHIFKICHECHLFAKWNKRVYRELKKDKKKTGRPMAKRKPR